MAVPVDALVSKIVSLLDNEANLLGEAHSELEEIKRELEGMRSFLEDTDKKKPHTQGEKTWVANVRELAYDVEDIIDEFTYHINKRQGRHRSTRYILKSISFPKELWERHKIASRLQKLKSTIKEIPERNQRYGLTHVEGTSSDDMNVGKGLFHGESSLFLKDEELVGIESDRDLLVGWLTNGEPQRTTISVVGMGGSGKTTLVAKAYSCQSIKRHFECCAWITVSQTYLMEDLLRSMIKQFYNENEMKEAVPVDLGAMGYRQLVEMLVNYLEPKRYVVVLDDVWESNFWNQIKVSLPNSNHGSRVMITTRKEDIASLSFEFGSHVHRIKPLEMNEAWNLFCLKAFPRNSNGCPWELKILAKDFVERCQGLPLAIVSLGGLLSTKSSEQEWRTVYSCLNWELTNNQMLQSVRSILLLSYNDLPHQLKHCFLYCCLFPEDYLIQRKRLLRLWMAEGFVEKVRGVTTPEDVADGYLMELIRRNMLQAVERNSFGLPKACKMHDLLRELALSISEEEKFGTVYDEQRAGTKADGASRRLSIQATDHGKITAYGSMSQLRSFFLFIADILKPASLNALSSGFKLLRVLDLEDATFVEKLPDNVVTLFNLRYLSLKRTQVQKLPRSIGRLLNLETLNIDDTKVKTLPIGIEKLENLRYLLTRRFNHGQYYAYDYVAGTQIPTSITTKLKNLQVLGCVEANEDIVKKLRNMTQLVRLEISEVRMSYQMDLWSSIQNMPLLRRLFVKASNNGELKMDAIKSPPPDLRRLSLVGKLEKIPQWFHSLDSLRALYLHWSRMECDPLKNLQGLANLRWLVLDNAYEGDSLVFLEGFKNLEILELHNCHALQRIDIFGGVMPEIKELSIVNCMNLKKLPRGIILLSKLQELTLCNVSEELTNRICGNLSLDWHLVKHIPKINHVSVTSSGWSQQSLS